MSSCFPPYDSKIFGMPKGEWNKLFLPDLIKVMLYAMFHKTAEWTPDEKIGKKIHEKHNALPDWDPKKRTFFWDQPVGNAHYSQAYQQRTYEMMHKANEIVRGLFDQNKGYLPFICKICELLEVPPELLAIQPDTTEVSKVAELLQYLQHRSRTFEEWTYGCQAEEALQCLKQYRRLLQFLQRIVDDRTYVLCDEEYKELQSYLSSLGNSIDLATFFSTLEGPNTDRYILKWIQCIMLSREMRDALWIEDWHTKPTHLESVFGKLQRKLVKLWTIVLTRISDETDLFEDLLIFLANVLPHLIKTKHFLDDVNLKDDLFRALVGIIPNVESPQDVYAEILAKHPETFKMFPRLFTKFRSILMMTVFCSKNLNDVKTLQEDPDATLEILYPEQD